MVLDAYKTLWVQTLQGSSSIRLKNIKDSLGAQAGRKLKVIWDDRSVPDATLHSLSSTKHLHFKIQI